MINIIVSHPSSVNNEFERIHELLIDDGLDFFHLRKPDWKDDEVERFFSELAVEVQSKTVVHQSGKQSCHSFEDIDELDGKEEYCFLSPFFDSIFK